LEQYHGADHSPYTILNIIQAQVIRDLSLSQGNLQQALIISGMKNIYSEIKGLSLSIKDFFGNASRRRPFPSFSDTITPRCLSRSRQGGNPASSPGRRGGSTSPEIATSFLGALKKSAIFARKTFLSHLECFLNDLLRFEFFGRTITNGGKC